MEGWINLHRQILDSAVFASEKRLKIWIWLLCKANYKDRFVKLNIGRGESIIELKRGQVLFGRFKAEEETGIDGSTIYKIINWMQDEGMIKIESNSHYTILTISNYDTFQTLENEKVTTDEQPSNNRVTTDEQPSNTPKKDKKDKKDKNNKEEELFLIYPFDSDEFKNSWELWIRYKSEQYKFKYKSVITEQAALNDLTEISKGDEETAISFIKHAISKGWKGIYEPNNYKNGNKQPKNGNGATIEELAEITARHFASDRK